jgi:outer membrane protein OmpA-like peptidoglycan-associated protein
MMNMKTTLAVAAAAVALATGAARAETSAPYISFGAGASFLEDMDFSRGGVTNERGSDNPGWGLSLAGGIGVFNNFRTELELSHRDNSLKGAGSMEADSVMLNFLYDIPIKFASFTPYIGAGAGASWINADNVGTASFGSVDDRDMVWAYQGIVGVASDLAPNWKITLDYRYFSTFDDPKFNSSVGTGKVEGEYTDHMVMVGLRYTFAPPPPPPMQPAAAPPPPAPAPAPAPLARSFLVFFDFDRSDITQDARKVIQQAADNSKKAGGVTRITLTGHADRSGSAQYNMRLSQRRADAVKAELVKLGIPAGDIVTVAKGETDPLVPTADGVREPRNRRVEIVF